ncbi:MAG: hypothetical protein EHM35_04175 [Planctomycetaceae bacterium]|nr:MAG: hypothetical protein EHM35_04175 [Planctomycetaceae bacterium]
MNESQSRPLPIWLLFLILALFCSTARADSRDLIFEIDPSAFPGSFFRIVLDHNGDYVQGQGDGYGGGTWYITLPAGYGSRWFKTNR